MVLTAIRGRAVEFAGSPGECYALAQVNQRSLAMLDPVTPASGLKLTLAGGAGGSGCR